MKRIFRNDVSPVTKEKQSVAHKGKKHSEETKSKIAKSLVKYWSKLPSKPTNNTTNVTDSVYGKKN